MSWPLPTFLVDQAFWRAEIEAAKGNRGLHLASIKGALKASLRHPSFSKYLPDNGIGQPPRDSQGGRRPGGIQCVLPTTGSAP
jgi:hypothetical protein